ncbi:hypothetical protein AB0392_54430 [Nonomuraea angiospora]|uniref:hypothetical protein n=1 Tax=Nonomuraea angiospora TaxID=46172 RepID=UPI00344C68FC
MAALVAAPAPAAAQASGALPAPNDPLPADTGSGSNNDSGDSADNTTPLWQKLTSLVVMPESPHQNDVIRVLMHCPTEANHAIVGSTAFPLKGSWRIYREVGASLSKRGFAKKGIVISRFAPLGDHDVNLKCVKVTIDRVIGVRKVKVLSEAVVPIYVRRFHVCQFFDC